VKRFKVSAGQSCIVAWLSVGLVVVLAAGCSFPGSVRSVVKIGLVAPFEGPQRNMAYDVLFATRLAVQEYNRRAAAGPDEPFVELVALNDDGRPAESRQQARDMAVDPDILGVVGPWSVGTALAALDAYRAAGLAVVLPDIGPGGNRLATPSSADGVARIAAGQAASKDLGEGFRALTGREPGTQAIQAYEAARLLLAAVRQAVAAHGQPTRAEVLGMIKTAKS
jgi:ABC-type branched-subunit amino acid transport system substrate-binding protein